MEERAERAATRPRLSKRSLVLLAAKVRTEQGVIDVRLRNLSQTGALLEAPVPPAKDTNITFERGDTLVDARVAWTAPGRFGIEFVVPIDEQEVLVHIGRPKPAPVRPKGPLFKT